MGTNSGSAPVSADERVCDLFADNSPPVNYCGELLTAENAIYGALRGIRDDFKGIVTLFRNIQNFDRRLMEVVKFSLPKELNTVGANGVANAESTDEGFAKALREAVAKTSNVARMGAYVSIASAITEAVRGLERKEAKLSERLSLQKPNSPEWRVAHDRRVKVCDSISVLKRRRQRVARMFFEVRKRVAEETLAGTNAMLSLFRDGRGNIDGGYVEAMLSHEAEPTFSDIAAVGENARRENGLKNYSNRKGWKS